MAAITIDVRERVVQAYLSGKSGTYAQTAELFGVGDASVSRWLRKRRASESLAPKPSGGSKPSVDSQWLMAHVEADEDARIVDRIADWQARSGRKVSVGAMWNALNRIGVTHKKRHW